MTKRPAASDHDPDHELPGLIDWGDALLDATMRAEQDRTTRQRRRWGRRAIPALAAIGVLAVPGAVVATRSIWDDPVEPVTVQENPSTPSVRLVEGHAGDVYWRVGGWNSEGRVCLRTEVWRGATRAAPTIGCSAPHGAAKLTVMPIVPNALAVIAGTTSDAAATVRVTPPSGDPVRVRTVAISPELLRRSHLAGATRVYVAFFPRGFDDVTKPPAVEAFDASGVSIGAIGAVDR